MATISKMVDWLSLHFETQSTKIRDISKIEDMSNTKDKSDPNSYRRYEFSTLIGQSPNWSAPIGWASKYIASI